VPSAIARPLETAVVPARPTQTALPATPSVATAPVTSAPPTDPAPTPVPALAVVPVSKMALATTPPRLAPRIEPPPVARAVATRPPAGPVYWVQVGAYRSAGAASRVAALVKGEILVAASYADQPLLRVRVGPFMDRARAAVRLHELEAKGWRAFIAEGR
jgi:cell division protein FtsN